jgi:hypothetical protein
MNSKLRTGQFIIDEKVNQITFLDTRFYKLGDRDIYLPSVSTVLEAYPKGIAFLEWLKKNGEDADSIRDAAAERGSIVHRLTEDYDNGVPLSLQNPDGSVGYKFSEWEMFEKYVEFTNRIKPEILSTELNLVSEQLGIGGTLDRRVNIAGKRLIVDIKTSKMLHNSYWLQLAAYKRLYEEKFPDDPIENVAILWLNANTRTDGKNGAIQGKGWQLVFPDRDIEYYWRLFECTQQLWLEENQGRKPRFLTYNLTHQKQ